MYTRDIHIWLHIYVYTHTYIYMYIYIYIYTHTYTYFTRILHARAEIDLDIKHILHKQTHAYNIHTHHVTIYITIL